MNRKPTHPGKIINEDYLLPLAISIMEMAAILGVSRKTVSKKTNERGVITPDMALRLSSALDTSPELWLNLQKSYDLWEAEHASNAWRIVKPLSPKLLHASG